jgi:protein-tyrosine phosphatase
VSEGRHLDWPDCFNVRDLGGLPAAGGHETPRGAVVRADGLDRLTDAGWSALLEHGVRTVIDLRNEDERAPDLAPRPAELTTVQLPLDGVKARAFWSSWDSGPQFGTPLYYRAHLQRFPQRSAAVLAAIAQAQPGGVVFHCVGGRDRSGQIAMLVLALAGVAPEVIAADYLVSHERLSALFAAVGREDEGPKLIAFLADRGTSAEEVIATTLSSLDVESLLLAGGLSGQDLADLRARLLGAPTEPAGSSSRPNRS